MPRTGDPDHNLYQVGRIWYLKVQISGREIRESLRTEDRIEARTKRDARLEELRGETHSWKEAVGRWLAEFLPENVDASTAKRYEVSIGQIAGAMVKHNGLLVPLEELPIERITLKTVGDIVAWSKKHRRGVTNATLRRDLTALSSVLHATIGWNWREDNPARNWDRSHIKERRDPIYLPTDEELKAVLAASPPIWAKAVEFLDATGMREMEGFRLRHDQIAPDRSGATLTETKRNRIRFVPFNDRAVSIVVSIPRHIKSPWVFWHHDGRPYCNVASRHAQIRSGKKVLKILGTNPSFSLHHLRHRFAVRYLREGGSIYDLQLILGHESVKTTEIYLDFLDPDTRHRAMRRAGGSA